MKLRNHLILSYADFRKLSALIDSQKYETVKLLEDELNRARVVSEKELPKGVVTMNSKVKFQDLETGEKTILTVVYPHEANIEANKISILAPVGSALIGLREGQVITWPVPSGKKKHLKVISVLPQSKSA